MVDAILALGLGFFQVLGLFAPAANTKTAPFELRWLSDVGAESRTAAAGPSDRGGQPLFGTVPGAAYYFSLSDGGGLLKLRRVAADSAIAYGAAATPTGVFVVGEDGSLAFWSDPRQPGAALRWRRELGERLMSVAWDGGEQVWVSSRSNRLLALAASDGRSLWTASLGGKAEAPALADGKDVLVATKGNALFRIDSASGTVRYRVDLPGPAMHSPVLAGFEPRALVTGTWNGNLLALEASSGKPRWSVQLEERLAGRPVATADSVITVTATGTVFCYDLAGRLRWKSPGAAQGAADLLLSPAEGSPRLLVVSKILTALDLASGDRLAGYPENARENLRRRFAAAMIEGEKIYSEAEKAALLEREAFSISGTLFGPARAFDNLLVFGTEEGWIYVFDATALRPIARYRAGQRASRPPVLAGTGLVAAAGDELFGYNPLTGETLWRRGLDAAVEQVDSGETLGVIAGDRLSVIDPSTGARQWSLRGRFQSICAPRSATTPWLAVDQQGSLRAFGPDGRALGTPLATASAHSLTPVPLGDGSWALATRDGRVFGASWQSEPAPGELTRRWETALEGPVAEIATVEDTLIVSLESGSLVALATLSGAETWRAPLTVGDRLQTALAERAVIVLGKADLRVYDAASGTLRFSTSAPVPALGATVRGQSLLWLDRAGRAHQVDMAGVEPPRSVDLGVPLEQAAWSPSGFFVTTTAGEVGFVDVLAGAPSAVEEIK
jgi:outer membrane protein assembly factor BamB